jgi:type III restriction enzyme
VPYRRGSDVCRYRPDFIVQIDDGHGLNDPLNLVVETKGYRGEDAKDKAATMGTNWVPGVNNLGSHGRWAFAEFKNVWTIQSEFEALIGGWFDEMVEGLAA